MYIMTGEFIILYAYFLHLQVSDFYSSVKETITRDRQRQWWRLWLVLRRYCWGL